MTTVEIVTNLRVLADWYEAHPGTTQSAALNLSGGAVYSCLPTDPHERTALLKAIGPFEKSIDHDGHFIAEVKVAAWSLRWFTARENVCTAKVVGKRMVPEQTIEGTPTRIISAHEEDIIEWDCGSVLAEPALQEA